jgi:hypothetical protein
MDDIYGTIKRPHQYSTTINTIELNDFIQEFGSWCDMQQIHNPQFFTPFMAWKALFQHYTSLVSKSKNVNSN